MILRKPIAIALLAGAALSLQAQTFNEWKDPNINEVNRLPMHSSWFAFESAEAAQGAPEASANYLSINGIWKFNWVADADARPTAFWTADYDDSAWGSMPVPGIWELNGYGDPLYVNTRYAWHGHYKDNPPYAPVKDNHVGSYRREVTVPDSWKGREVILHFGSVTSNVYLWVNGKFVGYSEDSKLECEFDITKLVKPGQANLIAFQVFRWCDGTYVECQDFWRFSGVARDCYLYSRPKKHIADVRITPDLDAAYADGTLSVEVDAPANFTVELLSPAGKSLETKEISGKGKRTAVFEVADAQKWTAETPYLYTVKVCNLEKGAVTEVIPIKAGIRKVEIKDSQVLVNGQPVLFKGADRHELDPDGGYVVSRERMLQDIRLFKEYNLNAVRTCHYPDDPYWYELCDRYGLYMVAEANIESHGMGYGPKTLAKNPLYAKTHLERNQRNVQRNYNHPAIIFWSLGNEAGAGPNFVNAYKWVKAEDPGRPVQYERAIFEKEFDFTDIYCPMYLDYAGVEKYCEDPAQVRPLIQCEYAHAMGNSQGGFMEYMDLVRKYPKYQGGFIWDFVDQGIRGVGKNGEPVYKYGGDFNDYDPTDANFCDNGLVNPDRVPNPHMTEVAYGYQDIWSSWADGKLDIFNERFFTDLSDVELRWELIRDGEPHRCGSVSSIDCGPQQHATVDLPLCTRCGKEFFLNLTYVRKRAGALLPAGSVVARQQLALKEAAMPAVSAVAGPAEPQLSALDGIAGLTVSGPDFKLEFDSSTGFICGYEALGTRFLLDGASLRPNFWRAPTDNDFGANLQRKYRVWHDPTFKLRSFDYATEGGLVRVFAEYDVVEVDAVLRMAYVISGNGAVEVTEKLVPGRGDAPGMFRFGMQLPMPKDFERIVYYGRGPGENYSDRKASAFMGVYDQSVSSQPYQYIRPQETGTKTDIRWWRVLDAAGRGLEVTADAPFSASALHYTVESLDEGPEKVNMHMTEVAPSDLTNLLLDKVQMGLGCENSWGAVPRSEYLLPYGEYGFHFLLTPVSAKF